jgi:hypothetical protein
VYPISSADHEVGRVLGFGNGIRLLDDNQLAEPSRSRGDIIRALETFPAEFKRVVLDPADREALMRPAFDGGWGIVEIIPHLKDWEEIYLTRVRNVLTEDRPALPSYDDTLWSIERDYRSQDPYEAFDAFSKMRAETVALLRDAASADWDRTGIHGYYGEITLHWLADHMADHDAEHLQQSQEALTV